MAKPYSQDLRDRVIDAVERGAMSRRAAAALYEISANRWRSNGLSGLNGTALARACRTWRPSRLQADAAPSSGGRAGRVNRTSRFRLCAIAFRPSAGSKPTPR